MKFLTYLLMMASTYSENNLNFCYTRYWEESPPLIGVGCAPSEFVETVYTTNTLGVGQIAAGSTFGLSVETTPQITPTTEPAPTTSTPTPNNPTSESSPTTATVTTPTSSQAPLTSSTATSQASSSTPSITSLTTSSPSSLTSSTSTSASSSSGNFPSSPTQQDSGHCCDEDQKVVMGVTLGTGLPLILLGVLAYLFPEPFKRLARKAKHETLELRTLGKSRRPSAIAP